VAISFRLHSELDVLINSVKVIKAFSQLAGSMWADDECVVYVAKPTEGFMGRHRRRENLKSHISKLNKCSSRVVAEIKE
jgi:hypothetical protein